MFGMLGVFAEFERALITERVRAGLARVKAEGPRAGKKAIGRPKLADSDPARAEEAKAMRARGVGVRKIARELGVGVGTVLRLTGAAAAS
jgi:DNA invertase Pin-like site-specific DNA recombinase